MYLLDTNVISEQRKPKPHGAVTAWLETVLREDLYVSAITIAEIQAGAERTRQQNPAKAAEIDSWLTNLVAVSQVLSMDAGVAREWARLMHRQPISLRADAWIAAAARRFNLTVVTRNVKDFAAFDVVLFNPFLDRR